MNEPIQGVEPLPKGPAPKSTNAERSRQMRRRQRRALAIQDILYRKLILPGIADACELILKTISPRGRGAKDVKNARWLLELAREYANTGEVSEEGQEEAVEKLGLYERLARESKGVEEQMPHDDVRSGNGATPPDVAGADIDFRPADDLGSASRGRTTGT